MYDLEKDNDYFFMIGAELLQVCVGSYQVMLRFSKDLSVSIEESCTLKAKGESCLEFKADEPNKINALVLLLGEEITKVNDPGNNDLEIIFSDEYSLILHGSSEDFESYTISSKDEEIIV